MTDKLNWEESSGNLFKDVGFQDAEAKRLRLRSFLMVALMKYIQNENITQKEAAKRLAVSQSRISNLMHFRIDLFSTDMLLDMLERAGFGVYDRIAKEVTIAIEKPELFFAAKDNA